ncbi:MAG: hypothetical protein EXR66_06130 [Dehalococcoidia bacterium]|nr:hypothetical protein [Dehalococcoidia bacterium]
MSINATSPRRRDLYLDGRYALHAFLGPSDEEFRVTGTASLVADSAERALAQAAIEFGAFDPDDPIYRLDIERALWGYWENAGQPGTRAGATRARCAARQVRRAPGAPHQLET